MKKQAALSLLIICVVCVTTFQATKAYFSDSAKSLGSNFTVGTLDLEVGGVNGANVEPFIIDNIGANANTTNGTKTWTVTNKGTLPGRLYFKIENIVNKENGCNSPESVVDTTCGNPGNNEGELGKIITANTYLGEQLVTSTNLSSTSQALISTAWNDHSPIIIQSGQSTQVKLEWNMAADGYGNEIQSDSLGFDVGFDLVQAAQ